MFDSVRPQQVPLRGMGQAMNPGSGFMGPFGIYSDLGPGRGGYQPPGFPGVSEEIQAPYGAETERHQYWCPDTGRYESLTIPEARARGCQAVAGGGGVAPYAKGAPPGLMGAEPRLGQVPFAGPASSPFFWPPVGGGYIANPQGGPLMSEELTSPQSEHIAREFHCYKSPDGQYVSVPFAQADAYKAAGYVAADYANCGYPPHAQPVGTPAYVMGQQGGGDGGGGAPPPVQGNPTPSSPPQQGISFDREFRNFWPGYYPNYAYPNYYYPPQQPQPQKLVCKRKEEDGEEVFECEPAEPKVPAYYPPAYPSFYPTFPVFRHFRPFFY